MDFSSFLTTCLPFLGAFILLGSQPCPKRSKPRSVKTLTRCSASVVSQSEQLINLWRRHKKHFQCLRIKNRNPLLVAWGPRLRCERFVDDFDVSASRLKLNLHQFRR